MQHTHIIFPALTKDDFLAQEYERVPKRVTLTVMSANVLRWLGGLSTIPDALLEAGRAVLCRAQQDGAIRDYRLYALGSDVVMHLMTLGQGLHNPKVGALASAVATAALTRAEELVTPMFEYMQTGFYMTQGDERGSHYMMLLPKPLTESVATVRSRGLLMKVLNRITGKDSPYAQTMHSVVQELYNGVE